MGWVVGFLIFLFVLRIVVPFILTVVFGKVLCCLEETWVEA